jgi:hypothetical protein
MKTQLINVNHMLSGMVSKMIKGARSLKGGSRLTAQSFSPDRISSYVIPVVKQLFRDNFAGSDAEMGMMVVFLKSYFLSAAYVVSHNAVFDKLKGIRLRKLSATVSGQSAIFPEKQVPCY